MRDTKKSIPGLDAEYERERYFKRVYADLTKMDTVQDAVHATKAKYAFVYCAHGTPDHMKSTLEALKSAGIEMVVFLSSFTIQGDPEAIQPSEAIPFAHAKVEVNLREVFGADGFVAVRAGSFASNTLQYKAGLEKDEVRIFMPDAKVDCIVPEDIGKVCGTILAKGPQDQERAIYLYGPQLLSQKETVRILAKAIGKNPKIEVADENFASEMFANRGIPAPVIKYMVSQMERSMNGQSEVFGCPVSQEELLNVQKYSGSKATTFEEWTLQNKQQFVS